MTCVRVAGKTGNREHRLLSTPCSSSRKIGVLKVLAQSIIAYLPVRPRFFVLFCFA